MQLHAIPDPLRERLGDDAARGLLELFESFKPGVTNHVIAVCTDRFERRLTEEAGDVRIQLTRVEGSLRQEIADTRAVLRQEITAMAAGLRQEMTEMGAGLRREIGSGRAELLKWCFLFWIGQAFTIAGSSP